MTVISEEQIDTVIHAVAKQLAEFKISLDTEHLFDLNDAVTELLRDKCCVEIAGIAGNEVEPKTTQQIKTGKQEIMDVVMEDIIGDYETPNGVLEWEWIKSNASYSHVDNGKAGVWDFMLNLSLDFAKIPPQLEAVIKEAKNQGAAYVLFHQGC